jgi:hypothetical protein
MSSINEFVKERRDRYRSDTIHITGGYEFSQDGTRNEIVQRAASIPSIRTAVLGRSPIPSDMVWFL